MLRVGREHDPYWKNLRQILKWKRQGLEVEWSQDGVTWTPEANTHKWWLDENFYYRLKPDHGMTYDQFYRDVLAQARAKRNHKRGQKWNSAYWLRLKPDDDTVVEFCYYIRHHWENNSWVDVHPRDRACVVVATLDATGMTLDNPGQHGRVSIPPTPAALAAKPELLPKEIFFTSSDATYNNLLVTLFPRFEHYGNGKTDEPGYAWFRLPATPCGNLIGPVRYDAASDELRPIWGQKTRTVDKAKRLELQRDIRATMKHLKMLQAMSVEIDTDEVVYPADALDGHAFLKLATGFAPTNHGQVLELIARATAINKRHPAPHKWYLQQCPLLTGRGLTGFRRRLYHATGIIDYV